ncbi:hypothetical protein OG2516_18845 [Oceanicola granulosus HTCC2516]|uniref:Uncharacterized protein n=1 Tax=Oceanicola granulosus (strain ATCC BAA-861 / DSM 15982 / KCTC 12143 / HTCC2516) TaxID=314256 RepID=Q2C9U9_OCEGH|nr:hypothetical protein [Oceanicola granulosus]EAR49449.1 hypothetical protein OG2516_18845 [Oceanicola granulosus HTCC2516]
MLRRVRIPPETSANLCLARLRRAERGGALDAPDLRLGPKIWLHADPSLAPEGTWRSPRGRLLDLVARPTGPGGWFALHVGFPLPSLAGRGLVGFALRGAAPRPLLLRAALRSGQAEGFTDAFFERSVMLRPESATHVDALFVAERTDIPERAGFRELVLFLPLADVTLSLHDLRLFSL